MKKFFESNLFYGIIAVAMAVFLLFYVASTDNPVTDKTFGSVSVAVNGLAEGYLLDADPRPVEIRVSGLRSTINLTFAGAVKAYVDLSEAEPGTTAYPVQCTIPGGLSLAGVRPEYVELTIDVFETREAQVALQIIGEVQPGYTVAAPVVSPSVVTLSGPKRILDQIAEVAADLDLTGRIRDFNGELPLVLLDKSGQEIRDNRINLSEAEASVRVGISEKLSSKTVSVRIAHSGSVDDHYIVTGMEAQPASVMITGPYAAVSAIEYLNTEVINLAPMTDTFNSLIQLITPPGVTILEGDTVEITIRIDKNHIQRTVTGIPVVIINAPEGETYGTLPATVDVTLAAYPEDFERAEAEGGLIDVITAYIDLTDLEEGPVIGEEYAIILEVPEEFLVMHVGGETALLTGPASEDESAEQAGE